MSRTPIRDRPLRQPLIRHSRHPFVIPAPPFVIPAKSLPRTPIRGRNPGGVGRGKTTRRWKKPTHRPTFILLCGLRTTTVTPASIPFTRIAMKSIRFRRRRSVHTKEVRHLAQTRYSQPTPLLYVRPAGVVRVSQRYPKKNRLHTDLKRAGQLSDHSRRRHRDNRPARRSTFRQAEPRRCLGSGFFRPTEQEKTGLSSKGARRSFLPDQAARPRNNC